MAAPMIGVLGGAGVAATIEFLARLEQVVTDAGAFRDAQHPEVFIYQATQVPSRSMFLEGRGESFVPGYIEAAKKLKEAGSRFGIMVCNTAHYAIDEIAAKSGLPFIDMIDENFAAALKAAPHAKTIGIMGSDGTRKAKLYENAAQRLGIKARLLQPNETHQAKITAGICNIKKAYHRHKNANDSERPSRLFHEAADHLIKAGADVVIFACTEIPIDFAAEPKPQVPMIDCLDVLVQACLRRYREIA